MKTTLEDLQSISHESVTQMMIRCLASAKRTLTPVDIVTMKRIETSR